MSCHAHCFSLPFLFSCLQGFRSFRVVSICSRDCSAEVLIPLEETLLRSQITEEDGWRLEGGVTMMTTKCEVPPPSLPPSLPPPTTDYQATVSVSPPAWQNRTTASPLVVTTYNTITMIAPSSHSLRVVSLCAILISKMKDLIKLCISTRTVLIRHVLICFVTSITLALIVWCINQKFRLKLKFKN